VYLLTNDLAAKKTVSGNDDEAPVTVYEKAVIHLPLSMFIQIFAKNILQKTDTKAKKNVFTLSSEDDLSLIARDLFFIYSFITPEVYFKKYPFEFLSNEISEDAKLEIAAERVKGICKATLGTLLLNATQILHIPNVYLTSDDKENLIDLVPKNLKTQLSL
jgi:hypothetical protein